MRQNNQIFQNSAHIQVVVKKNKKVVVVQLMSSWVSM